MKNCQPKVSIVVPVYKVEQYIKKCAESLFSQTWENLELIFVDNETPDASISILRELLEHEYAHMQSKTRIISVGNACLGVVRAEGISLATGEYLIQVDSDDWVEADYVERLVTKAIEEDADIVYCNFYKEYDCKPHKVIEEPELPDQSLATRLSYLHNSEISAFLWNKMVRRSLYKLDEMVIPVRSMHEDLLFQTQIFYSAGKMVRLDRTLYHYRRGRKGALTRRVWYKRRKASAETLLDMYQRLPSSGSPLDYCRQDLLMRAGWYAVSTLNFQILKSCPEAVRFLAEMDFKRGRRVSLPQQVILKACCCLLR